MIDLMTTNSPPGVREVVRAFIDAALMVEPLQIRLWNSAGITLTQLRILRALREGPHCAGDLARAVGVSAPSLTRLLDRLMEDGCVERRVSDADRRRVDVCLTEAGRRMVEGHLFVEDTAFHRAVESMSPDERMALFRSLRDFTERVRLQETVVKIGQTPPGEGSPPCT